MSAASGSKTQGLPPSGRGSGRDAYRAVILLLAVAASFGMMAGVIAGFVVSSAWLLDAGLLLGISTGVLVGVALAQRERAPGAGSSRRARAGAVKGKGGK